MYTVCDTSKPMIQAEPINLRVLRGQSMIATGSAFSQFQKTYKEKKPKKTLWRTNMVELQ